MRTSKQTTKDKIEAASAKLLVAGFLGLVGTGAYNVLDTSWNRVEQSLDGSIQSLRVHDGLPYFSDERTRIECVNNVLKVKEQTALLIPIYWNGGAGDFVVRIQDCTLDSIRKSIDAQEGFVFTQHVLAHMGAYINIYYNNKM